MVDRFTGTLARVSNFERNEETGLMEEASGAVSVGDGIVMAHCELPSVVLTRRIEIIGILWKCRGPSCTTCASLAVP